jgi:predicted DNA-binding protein with PD1-like motif
MKKPRESDLFRRLVTTAAFLLLALVVAAAAQESRREVVKHSPTPADDAKSNSDRVPDVYALSGRFERVLVFRFKYETDLLAGLEKIVKEEKVRNAVILSGIGSVKSYALHQVTNRTFPSRNMFVTNPTGSADIIGMNGYIIDGRVHAHVTLATSDKAFGGHLEPGTKVFTFAVVTVGVMGDGLDFTRLDDKTYR